MDQVLREGIYRITPLGEHTAFECIVAPVVAPGAGVHYELIDLKTFGSLSVSVSLMEKMRPQFVRAALTK